MKVNRKDTEARSLVLRVLLENHIAKATDCFPSDFFTLGKLSPYGIKPLLGRFSFLAAISLWESE